MGLENLDMVDRKILAALDRDARISYSALGKRIRVAKETVKYRVQHLLSRGVIVGFYTVMDFSKMGYMAFRLYLRLQNTSPSIEEALMSYLMDSKAVVVLYRTNGPFNIVMGVMARDAWEYERFWDDLKARFGSHLSGYHLSILTSYLEFSRPYLLPSSKTEKVTFATITNSRPEKLDNLDFRLLVAISNNARVPLVHLAQELKVSVATVRQRLKSLRSGGVICGFRPILNLNLLGRAYYKVDIWFRKFDRVDEIRRYVLAHPEVAYSESSIVMSDLEIDIEACDFESFIASMDALKERFPEDIREYAYYSLIKTYKVGYAPSFLARQEAI